MTMTEEHTHVEPESENPPAAAKPPEFALVPGSSSSLALNGLFVLSVFYTLYFARFFLLPLVLALFFSLLFSPVVRGLERLKLSQGFGAAVVVLGVVVVLAGSVFLLVDPAKTWLERAPLSLMRIEEKIRDIKEPVEKVNQATKEVEKLTQMDGESPEIQTQEESFSEKLMGGLRRVGAGIVVILIMLYFLLASGDTYLRKMVRVLPNLRDKKRAVEIARHLQRDISNYLLTITVINFTLGLAVTLALYLLDMPNPLLWGTVAAVLNYIPYLGAMTGVAMIGVAAALTFDLPRDIFLPPLVYFLLTAAEGYLVTPLVVGRRLTLNPVVILIGLIFWGWLWGVVGFVLAVPLLVSIKIFCDHLDPLAPVGEFMGR